MANRRMLSKFVFENDDFLDMPAESQALYAHLVINADDDGFIDHPNAIRRMTGFSVDSLKLLIVKGFLLPFSDSLVVVAHWEMQNHIQPSKKTPTVYTGQKEMLTIDEQGIYRKLSDNFRRNAGEMPADSMILSGTLTDNNQINSGYNNTAIDGGNQAIQQCEANYQTISGEVSANNQHSIVQDSIVQDSINNNCAKSGRPQDVDEIGNMFNEYCPSLGKAPKSDEMSDSVRKKLINCLLSPLTIDNYKKLLIDAENESDELKKRTEEKQYSSDFELVLDILQELGKKLQNKTTA